MSTEEPVVDRKFLDLYSRQIGTYGMDTMVRLISLKVLVLGCRGVGAEAAKNLALAGVHTVSLYDPAKIAVEDLGSNFAFTEDSVGKATRAAATARLVSQLNPNTRVAEIPAVADEVLMAHDVVVVTAAFDKLGAAEVDRINAVCRSRSGTPTSLVVALNFGAVCSVFVDHGPQFVTKDPDGRASMQKSITEAVHRVDKKGRSYTRLRLATPEGMQPGALRDRTQVTFSEVRGLEKNGESINAVKAPFDGFVALNDPPSTVRIYPSLEEQGYSAYVSGGFVHEAKEVTTRDFRTMQQCRDAPPPLIFTDSMMDGTAENDVHLFVSSMLAFADRHGRTPKLCDDADAEAFAAVAKEVNAACAEAKRTWVAPKAEESTTEEDSELPTALPPPPPPEPFAMENFDDQVGFFRRTARLAAADLQPMCAVQGAIVAQEVVKVTGKYTPIYQFLHLNFSGVLPEASFECPAPTRYRDHTAMFGAAFVEKVMNMKMFMVGCGALGCENMKNFALSGICCGPRGHLTVTDNDRIEVSNLNRQFLFREDNVGQPKSAAAARARLMNPGLKVTALQDLVSDSTEHVFNDAFWRGLDVVTNALDNMKARLYVDGQCVLHEKVLVEAGTMGTGGNVDIVVPHKTSSYADGGGADETGGIPMCTLRNFPYIFDHCIEWARAQFDDLFVSPILMTEQLRDDPAAFAKKVRSEVFDQDSAGAKRSMLAKNIKSLEAMSKVVDVLAATSSGVTMEACADLAWAAFHGQFRDRILSLIKSFPKDAKKRNGEPFWSGQRKFPTAIDAALDDESVQEYLIAATNLYACMLGIHGEKHPPVANDPNNRWKAECRTDAFLRNHFAAKAAPVVAIAAIDDLDEETAGSAAGADATDAEDEKKFNGLVDSLTGRAASMLKASSLDFEKDDDDNFHIDFVTAAANLRARNYDIATKDRMAVKLVAGKIIPAIATTTAAVTGYALMELFKVLQDMDVSALRNGMLDLGCNVYTMFDRDPPTKVRTQVIKTYMPEQDYTDERTVVAFPNPHTKYDKLFVNVTPATTVESFVEELQQLTECAEGGPYECVTLGVGKGMIWNGLPSHANFKAPLMDVIAAALAPESPATYWKGKEIFPRLSVNMENADGDEVVTATVVLRLPAA